MKKRNSIIIFLSIMGIAVLGLTLYKNYPIFEACYYNRYICVSDVKLLMTEEELTSTFDEKGEFVYGMGGHGWRFNNNKVFVMISSNGLFKNKVSSIDTENSSHSIIGIKVGDSYDSALDILQRHGFKELSGGVFIKGNIQIQIFGYIRISRLRISIQDPAYKDVVF